MPTAAFISSLRDGAEIKVAVQVLKFIVEVFRLILIVGNVKPNAS